MKSKININKDDFEKLCRLQCTLVEISSWFSCSKETIENWCKQEYDYGFSEIYKKYSDIGGVVHTHSTWAVTFAQAGMDIPAFGTTHADYFYGDIPCTRNLTKEEIEEAYEKNTGVVIVETIGEKNPMEIPGIVVKNHGPFAWGKTPSGAVYNAVVLDKVAEMAYKTMTLNPNVPKVHQYLLDKHYFRKHGVNAYYGQGSEEH